MVAKNCYTNQISPRDDDSGAAEAPQKPDALALVESVEQVVSGFSIIGHACNALRAAGWSTKITANRITVDDAIEAQLIPSRFGTDGLTDARWVVSQIALSSRR